jgi:hypothetical protein
MTSFVVSAVILDSQNGHQEMIRGFNMHDIFQSVGFYGHKRVKHTSTMLRMNGKRYIVHGSVMLFLNVCINNKL